MPATYQNIDRQLGELVADVRALRIDQERHAEDTAGMRETVVEIKVELAAMKAERRALGLVHKSIMTALAAVAGALGGHVGLPGAH